MTMNRLLSAAVLTASLTIPYASAQAQPAPAASERLVPKATTFEAVSIRPSGRPLRDGGAWGVSDNRYFAKNAALSYIILQAYSGQMSAPADRLKNAPDWVTNDGYNITAKADDATANSWKPLRQAQAVALAAPLLRAMLEDRCKLVVHTVPVQLPAYALVLSKHPLKLKEAQADEPPPNGSYGILEGGWMIVYPKPGADVAPFTGFRKVTMAQFTEFMSLGGPAIIDQTGLQGMYDFDLPRFDPPQPATTDGAPPSAPPPLDKAHAFNWQAVGLELKPIQVPGVDVVIDHIERPTEN